MSVLEVVRIVSKPGRGDEFAERLRSGLAVQAEDPACTLITTRRSVERPDEYLLELVWTSVEAHTAWQQENRERWRAGVGWEIVDGGAMGLKHYAHVATVMGPPAADEG
jgi:heme-degrading monooxygenase HmoA